MNITISHSLAATAAHLHASRFFSLGQSAAMEGYDMTHRDHIEAVRLTAEGRKLDLIGIMFYRAGRKLDAGDGRASCCDCGCDGQG